jgi:hypothetical protein
MILGIHPNGINTNPSGMVKQEIIHAKALTIFAQQ